MNELRMNGFESLTMDEMMSVDGGGFAGDVISLVVGAGGTVVGVLTTLGYVSLSAPVSAAVAVATFGVSAYIFGCYYYPQRTPSNYSITRRR